MSYNTYTVESTIYIGHTEAIRQLRLFKSDYFVSIDESGVVNVWSLKDTAIGRRRSSRQEDPNVIARQNVPIRQTNRRDRLQSIENGANKITCILISNDSNDLHLFAATKTGEILVYLWIETQKKFELRKSHSFRTNEENIVKILKIHNYLMTITSSGHASFFNLIDNGRDRHQESFSNEPPIDTYVLPHENHANLIGNIIIIFASCVYPLSLRQINNKLSVERLNEYNLNKVEQNFIVCSAITEDSRYLLLGTRKGIIVIEPNTNREILRSSISDSLVSISVCSVEESAVKYVIISATKKSDNVIYLHGVCDKDNLMQWSTNKIDCPLNSRDTMVSWFRGMQLFDVHEQIFDEDSSEEFTLVAADFKNLVHTKQSKDNFQQTVSLEHFDSSQSVTAISIGLSQKFIGCENGIVYEIEQNKMEIVSFNEPVKYMKFYDEYNILIASTSRQYCIYTSNKNLKYDSRLIQDTFVYDSQYIVFVKIDGSFEVRTLI